MVYLYKTLKRCYKISRFAGVYSYKKFHSVECVLATKPDRNKLLDILETLMILNTKKDNEFPFAQRTCLNYHRNQKQKKKKLTDFVSREFVLTKIK